MTNVKITIITAKPLLRKDKAKIKLLKPLSTRCPICGSELYHLTTLNSYYCFNCKRYVF